MFYSDQRCYLRTKPGARVDYATAVTLLQPCAALALCVPVHVGQDFPFKKSRGFNSVRVTSDQFIVPF